MFYHNLCSCPRAGAWLFPGIPPWNSQAVMTSLSRTNPVVQNGFGCSKPPLSDAVQTQNSPFALQTQPSGSGRNLSGCNNATDHLSFSGVSVPCCKIKRSFSRSAHKKPTGSVLVSEGVRLGLIFSTLFDLSLSKTSSPQFLIFVSSFLCFTHL